MPFVYVGLGSIGGGGGGGSVGPAGPAGPTGPQPTATLVTLTVPSSARGYHEQVVADESVTTSSRITVS